MKWYSSSQLNGIKREHRLLLFNAEHSNPQDIYKPDNIQELKLILDYVQTHHLPIHFVKNGNVNFIKHRFKKKNIFVDLANVDSIIKDDESSHCLYFQPGLEALQLQTYILEKPELIRPVDKSLLLLNDLLFYNQEIYSCILDGQLKNDYQYLYQLIEKNQLNRTMIFSFNSLETLFKLFPAISTLKKELGGILKDIFLVNKRFNLGLSQVLRLEQYHPYEHLKIIKSLKKHDWHLVIELSASQVFFEAINDLIKDLFRSNVYYTTKSLSSFLYAILKKKSNTIDSEKLSTKHVSYTLKYLTDFNIYSLVKNYHNIYLASHEFKINPAILMQLNQEDNVVLNVRCYYQPGNLNQIQNISRFYQSLTF